MKTTIKVVNKSKYRKVDFVDTGFLTGDGETFDGSLTIYLKRKTFNTIQAMGQFGSKDYVNEYGFEIVKE